MPRLVQNRVTLTSLSSAVSEGPNAVVGEEVEELFAWRRRVG